MSYERVVDMGYGEDERQQLAFEVTTRAVEQAYPSPQEFQEAVGGDRRLTAYMGIDPTSPDMHVGHESQLLKMRNLQQLGHKVILLIGDFTAMIGDPTDKSAARVKLTKEEVLENASGYKDQASKILDFDHPENPIELAYNSTWLGKMNFADVVELASEFTVQQVIQRDMFEKRIAEGRPVGLHEFMYPMMQGWDSVQLGVDIEVGGSDQIFNMLAGSTLVRRHLQKQKFVLAGKLLADPGGRKMGKTEGNMITLNDTPGDMFHKIMMWSDKITPHALELCSSLPMDQVEQIRLDLEEGRLSGLDGKLFLAKQIVADLHGGEAASQAEAQYNVLASSNNEIDPELLTTFSATDGQTIIELLRECGLAPSNAQARRLLAGNGVRVNGQTVDETWTYDSSITGVQILQVGKKKIQNHRRLISDTIEE